MDRLGWVGLTVGDISVAVNGGSGVRWIVWDMVRFSYLFINQKSVRGVEVWIHCALH